MLKQIYDYLGSAQAAALVAFLITAITYTFKLVKPLWQKKITTEKNNHVKQALEVGLKFANAVVPELAVMVSLSKSDRKKEAVRFVGAQLTANGFDVDTQTIEALVEQAYQAYKAAGGDNHFAPVTPAPSEDVQNPVPSEQHTANNAQNVEKSDQNA